MKFVGPSWLFLWVSAFLLCAYLLVSTIFHFVRSLRKAVLHAVPVREEQEVFFAQPGHVILHVEGPIFTTLFRKSRFELLERETRRPVPTRPVIFRTHSSTLRTYRLALRRFHVEMPGPYLLRISGLRPDADYSKCSIILTRPYGFSMVLHILGIVLLANAIIWSLIAIIASLSP